MSNNKQTFNHNPNQSSVDWVIGEILKHEMTFFGTASIPLYIIEQAKAMHKHEMIQFALSWSHEQANRDVIEKEYNETFQ